MVDFIFKHTISSLIICSEGDTPRIPLDIWECLCTPLTPSNTHTHTHAVYIHIYKIGTPT